MVMNFSSVAVHLSHSILVETSSCSQREPWRFGMVAAGYEKNYQKKQKNEHA